jgi:predicted deacylase
MSKQERSMAGVFDLEQVAPGTKAIFELDVAPLSMGPMLQLPLLVARGAKPGKTIVALAGVHGDEYEGMWAARDVFKSLDPTEMSGNYVSVPVCNPPAFAARNRESPLDGQNLARVFPGNPNGTMSERTAAVLIEQVLPLADFLIDLHSSSSYGGMPLLVGFPEMGGEQERIALEAAQRFGTPIIWGHPTMTVGRSLSEPHTWGVPWLYTESPSGSWLDYGFAQIYADGVRNVMRYLDILPGDAPVIPNLRRLHGEGDTDAAMTTPVSGFLRSVVKLLDEVEAGQLLGVVEDLAGRTLHEIRAPKAGTVIVQHMSPPVTAGTTAYLLT